MKGSETGSLWPLCSKNNHDIKSFNKTNLCAKREISPVYLSQFIWMRSVKANSFNWFIINKGYKIGYIFGKYLIIEH